MYAKAHLECDVTEPVIVNGEATGENEYRTVHKSGDFVQDTLTVVDILVTTSGNFRRVSDS